MSSGAPARSRRREPAVCFRWYDLGVLQALGVIVVQLGIALGLGVLLAGAG